MYALNGMLVLEQEDISNLKLMTGEKFDQTAITMESMNTLLNDLEKKVADIPDDTGVGNSMMKIIINEGVAEMREKLASLQA